MRTRLTLLFIAALCFLALRFVPQSLAQSDTGWEIESFDAAITLNEDTSVDVKETIQVDFHDLEKHGIYRTIPVKYPTRYGNRLNIRFTLEDVVSGDGNKVTAKTTYKGDNVTLRLGEEGKTVTGLQTYVISYEVQRVVTQPGESAEFYWNVTGADWPVPILAASATITTPPSAVVNTICFTGFVGSIEQDCSATHNSSTAQFTSDQLSSGEGLTIAVALETQAFAFPGKWQVVWFFIVDNWFYLTPLGVFLLMLNLYWHRGRDKQYKNMFADGGEVESVPLFEKIQAMNVFAPLKELSPGEVGVLIDEKVHLRDITAVAIDLARRGYFTIKEVSKGKIFKKTDYELTYTSDKKQATGNKKYEESVLSMLFGEHRKEGETVLLSKPHASAYTHLDAAQKELYEYLTEHGYFAGNPHDVRTRYLVAGFIITIFGPALAGPFLYELGLGASAYVSPVLSGLIIIGFSFFMPARTPKGRKAMKEIVGLKEWVRLGAWREQIHEKHTFLEEVLPFTIAFGLTGTFLEAFSKADLGKLAWYKATNATPTHFTNSFNSFSHSLNSGVSSTRPRSSSSGGSGFSGGSSGGGFGGGGGGSW